MSEIPPPKFTLGEVAILQPPHPSAKHFWGKETTIYRLFWSGGGDDAMGGHQSKWCYETDIPAPPPTDLPEDQHDHWVWCEYDLRKKHDAGMEFESIMAKLTKGLVKLK